ncbi:MAG: hypothetical protein IKW76_09620, partial [Clostridia bacterium]|nr:hypothetical protein [Clostridia bacterium]
MDFFKNTQGLSQIPQKELNVVQSYFLLSAIFRKDYSDTRSYDLLFKSVLVVFQRITKMHFTCAVKALAEITGDFLRFIFDVALHPGIRKKYHLK